MQMPTPPVGFLQRTLSSRSHIAASTPPYHPNAVDRSIRFRHKARMLVIQNLSVRVAGRLLLDEASVRIPAGSRVGLVGRNGTGKTTLFNVITGDLGAEQGDLTVRARAVRPAAAGSAFRSRKPD